MTPSLIAVVDDDDRVRKATASVLRSMGYATRTFTSGSELLAADISDVDCILSDYQMPGMSGLELLETLKIQAPSLPVIIMTAYSKDGVAEKARKLGAAGFIEKPLDDDILIRLITGALA